MHNPRGTGVHTAGEVSGDGSDVSATSMLERFGFTGDRLTARVADLSGGERRRFQLLRLLLSEPNVLLLDEPSSGLDPLMEQIFRDAVTEAAQRGATATARAITGP